MSDTKKIKSDFGNIHLIPFDIGFMFYDVYTPSNKGNYFLWQEFAKELVKLKKRGWKFLDKKLPPLAQLNFKNVFPKLKLWHGEFVPVKDADKDKECYFGQVKQSKSYLNTFEECLCEIKLDENLYCYILESGIAVFVIGCFNKEGLNEYITHSQKCSQAVQMRFQNEIINRALLINKVSPDYDKFLVWNKDDTNLLGKGGAKNVLYEDVIQKDNLLLQDCKKLDRVLSKQRELINLFKIWCWKNIQNIVTKINNNLPKKHPWHCARPHTSKPNFKQFGFSFSANFIIDQNFNDSTTKQINYLQDRSISYKSFDNPDFWKDSNQYFKSVTYKNTASDVINTDLNSSAICVPPLNIVKMNNYKIAFSSNTVFIQPLKKNINSLDDFLKNDNTEMTDLLFAEIDILTKWFNADNCIDNDLEKEFKGIETLQTIEGQIEYYSAELDNPTNSKIETLYLMYRSRIVDTTKVKELYDSITQEIKILKAKKIEQINSAANEREKWSRIARVIVDCFIAGFTAAGIGKTIVDVERGAYVWWENLIFWFFVGAFVLTRCILGITDYRKNKKKLKELKKR